MRTSLIRLKFYYTSLSISTILYNPVGVIWSSVLALLAVFKPFNSVAPGEAIGPRVIVFKFIFSMDLFVDTILILVRT